MQHVQIFSFKKGLEQNFLKNQLLLPFDEIFKKYALNKNLVEIWRDF